MLARNGLRCCVNLSGKELNKLYELYLFFFRCAYILQAPRALVSFKHLGSHFVVFHLLIVVIVVVDGFLFCFSCSFALFVWQRAALANSTCTPVQLDMDVDFPICHYNHCHLLSHGYVFHFFSNRLQQHLLATTAPALTIYLVALLTDECLESLHILTISISSVNTSI